MSGHSKWSQIKRQKGVADIKKGQVFTKLANAITITVRDVGGVTNPEQNFKLRLVIEKARSVNMPKENIQRAIEKGIGKGGNRNDLQEVVYEGFFGGTVAIMVDAVTDNQMRTTSEIKNIFNKNGGSLGVPGAVSYMFKTKGLITVTKTPSITTDELFLLAADGGAEDIEEGTEEYFVTTKPEELAKVKDALGGTVAIASAELIRQPVLSQALDSEESLQKLVTFINKLEALDDVQKVYSNVQVS